MKKLLFISLLLPACLFGQNCKVVSVAGGHKGTDSISVKEIIKITALSVQNGCADNKNYVITSYEFTSLSPDKKSIVSYTNDGPGFSDKIKIAIREAKPGYKLYFDIVKVKGPDGKASDIPGITLIIK